MKIVKNLFSPYRGFPREVYVLFTSRMITAVGAYVMPLLTLILTDKIGLDTQEAGVLISITGFIYLPASILGGKFADSFGRKKTLVVFGVLSAISYIICGFLVPSITMYYFIVAAGALSIMSHPAQDALIADLTDSKNRSNAYAFTYLGYNLGFAIGPIIGGMLFNDFLSWVFIGDAITTIIAMVLIMIFINEKKIKKNVEKKDYNELEKGSDKNIFHVLLSRPILIYVGLILCLFSFSYAQWSFLLPHHVNTVYPENGAKIYGMLASFNGIIVIVATPLLTKLFVRLKNINKMAIGGILYAVGFGMLGFVAGRVFFFACVFLITFGEVILAISSTPFIQNHTPMTHRGRISSIMSILINSGHIIGPLIIGSITKVYSIEIGWYLVLMVSFVGAIVMKLMTKVDTNINRKLKVDVNTDN